MPKGATAASAIFDHEKTPNYKGLKIKLKYRSICKYFFSNALFGGVNSQVLLPMSQENAKCVLNDSNERVVEQLSYNYVLFRTIIITIV